MTGHGAVIITIAAILIIAGAGAVVLLGNSGPGETVTGTISIFIKDKPEMSSTNWTSFNVTFAYVQIHQSGAGNDSGWKTLSIVNYTIDLRALTNVSQLLARGNVLPGNYTQIRLVASMVEGVLDNGTAVALEVPSGELKITRPFKISADQITTLTIDIDLDHSIIHADDKWMFKPVLGSISEQ